MGNIYSNTCGGEDEEANLQRTLGSLTRRQQEEYERCKTNNEKNIYLRAILSERNKVEYEEMDDEELQKVRKGLTRRQRREYDNCRDDPKLMYLKAVYSERKRGDVHTLTFITVLIILTFGSIIILNEKCAECEITKYSEVLLNGIVYIIQALEATIVTVRDGYYDDKSLWFRFFSFSLYFICGILFIIFGVYWVPFGIYCQLG